MSCCLVTALDQLERHTVKCVKCGGTTRVAPLRENRLEKRAGRARMWPQVVEAIECVLCGFWVMAGSWIEEARVARAAVRGLS